MQQRKKRTYIYFLYTTEWFYNIMCITPVIRMNSNCYSRLPSHSHHWTTVSALQDVKMRLKYYTQYWTQDQEHNPKSCLLLRFSSLLKHERTEQLEKRKHLLYWGFVSHQWPDEGILADWVVIYSQMWTLGIISRDPFMKTSKQKMYVTQKRWTKLKFVV